MRGIKFIVVEENAMFRETLKKFIVDELSSTVIAEVSCSEELMTLNNINSADTIFVTLKLPGINDFEIIKEVLWNYPLLKVIGITSYTDKVYLLRLFEAGFRGCIDKNRIFDEVADAVREVTSGHYYFSSSILKNCMCD